LRDRPVGADDAVPGEIVSGRDDAADEARCARFDVAVGADVALRDRTDALDDSPASCVAARYSWAAFTAHYARAREETTTPLDP
jgi:hypothetical protein